MESLVAGAGRLGIRLSSGQVAQFTLYCNELLAWNRRMNLTAITEPPLVETRHFLDSLTVALAWRGAEQPENVLDVGSGAGFPGIPLRIAFPDLRLTLLEATRKKAGFLRHVLESLGLLDVQVIAARAEDAAREPAHRERYDLVTARAVAALPALAELTLPFCRVGGLVAAQKKGDIEEEVASARGALRTLGGQVLRRVPVRMPELEEERELVVLEKTGPTPALYPRRAGMRQKGRSIG